MPERSEESSEASPSPSSPKDGVLRGPRFDAEALQRLSHADSNAAASPTWRGWVMGLFSVALLCKLVPVTDYVLRGTRLTLNVLPLSSIFFIFMLIVLYNVLLMLFRGPLGLRRQDLALVFCMTMVANQIPGHGFLSYFSAEVSGAYYYATPENQWNERIQPYIPPGLTPHDPEDPASNAPRPIEWLYTGLPPGRSIPWGAWAGPYARWALMMLMLYGMMFAVCALLHRQWADAEKLPFPLAQVPREMMAGLEGGRGGSAVRAFLRDPLAWWGMGLVFLLHSWNALSNYFPGWPSVELRNTSFGWRYLTEPPWNHLNPLWIVIYPSIVGLTYLIATEISFSLWFFYLVLKVGVLIAVGMGYGQRHGHFMYSTKGWPGTFINQGTGALIAMVLAGLWMARGPLKHSLKQAVGLEAEGVASREAELSPRLLWLLLTGCFGGLVIWLMRANVGAGYAALAVLACLVIVTGVARLVSEGGIFYPQVMHSPVALTQLAVPPAVMGSQAFVPLTMWSRLAVFDYYRLAPMVPIITALQVGRGAGLRRRPLYAGIFLAVLLAMGLGFFGFFSTIYRSEGAGSAAGWVLASYPRGEYHRLANRTSAIESYRKKKEALAAEGKTMPASEVPEVARRDTTALSWIGVGMLVMFLFVFLRTRIFWWPHPIGYVVWTGQRAISLMWFSFLLGWAIKTAIAKFGGLRVYQRWRRFFVGMIAGEAAAAFFWIAIAYATGYHGGYTMHFN